MVHIWSIWKQLYLYKTWCGTNNETDNRISIPIIRNKKGQAKTKSNNKQLQLNLNLNTYFHTWGKKKPLFLS